MSKNKNQKFPLLSIILFVALLLRIVFILVFLKEKLYWDDEFAYDRLAIQLIEQRAYVNEEGARTAFRAPGYPIFLALNYLLFGRHFWTIRMVQAFVDCLTLILIFLIARQMFNQKVAIIAGMLYAIYPLFIYTSSTFFPTTLSVFFLALFIFLLMQIEQNGTTILLILLGMVAGLSVLTVPTFLPSVLLAMFWLFFHLNQASRPTARPISIIMLLMIVMLLPWIIRNYLVFNQPFLIATNSGYNFWMGNNPWATPTTGNSIAFPDSLARKLSQAKSEVEQEKIFYQDAFQYIKKNSGKFIALTFKKALNLWQFYPTPATGYKMLPTLSKLMSIFSYGPVLLLAIFGLIISWREKKKYVLLFILLFLSFTISYAFFITKARFRLPLDPYLIILAGVTIRHFWENRKIIFSS